MKCRVREKERLEEVTLFRYLGTLLCKYSRREVEVRERAAKGRLVVVQ